MAIQTNSVVDPFINALKSNVSIVKMVLAGTWKCSDYALCFVDVCYMITVMILPDLKFCIPW